MQDPEKIKAQAPISDKCEKCGLRPKHREQHWKGDEIKIRKWCNRCIERNRRPEFSEITILNTVEYLYQDARLQDLAGLGIVEQISSKPPEQDVYFYGPPGIGKTHAMAAFIRYYMNKKYSCKRINFDDFCCLVRSTMSSASKQTEWDLVQPLKDVDILFIDDLGLRSKQETDFAYITLYSILNKRQERMLPTFLSSNKDLDRLRQAFDERIVSRLRTALQIEMKGADRRRKEKKE